MQITKEALRKELNRDFKIEINHKFVGAGTLIDRWGVLQCYWATRKLKKVLKDKTIMKPKKGLRVHFRVK